MLYLVTLTFSHDVVFESIDGLGNQERCSINCTLCAKVAKIECTNLNYNTSYSLVFHGVVIITHMVAALEVLLKFTTKKSARDPATGKHGIYIFYKVIGTQ